MSRDYATQAAFNWLTNDPETASFARTYAFFGGDVLKNMVTVYAYDAQNAARDTEVMLAGLFADLLADALNRVDWEGLAKDILET